MVVINVLRMWFAKRRLRKQLILIPNCNDIREYQKAMKYAIEIKFLHELLSNYEVNTLIDAEQLLDYYNYIMCVNKGMDYLVFIY